MKSTKQLDSRGFWEEYKDDLVPDKMEEYEKRISGLLDIIRTKKGEHEEEFRKGEVDFKNEREMIPQSEGREEEGSFFHNKCY